MASIEDPAVGGIENTGVPDGTGESYTRHGVTVLNLTADRELFDLIRGMKTAKRRQLNGLTGQPGTVVPVERSIPTLRQNLIALPKTSHPRALALIGHRHATELASMVRNALGHDPCPDHVGTAEHRAALNAAFHSLLGSIGAAKALFATYSYSYAFAHGTWPLLDGLGVVDPSSLITPRAELGSIEVRDDWRDVVASAHEDRQRLAAVIAEDRVPTNVPGLDKYLAAVDSLLHHIGDASITAVRTLGLDVEDLVDDFGFASVGELHERIEVERRRRDEHRSSLLLSMVGLGDLAPVIAALVAAAAGDEEARAAGEALAALALEAASESIDDGATAATFERARRTLEASAAWRSTGVDTGKTLMAAMRGRVKVDPDTAGDGDTPQERGRSEQPGGTVDLDSVWPVDAIGNQDLGDKELEVMATGVVVASDDADHVGNSVPGLSDGDGDADDGGDCAFVSEGAETETITGVSTPGPGRSTEAPTVRVSDPDPAGVDGRTTTPDLDQQAPWDDDQDVLARAVVNTDESGASSSPEPTPVARVIVAGEATRIPAPASELATVHLSAVPYALGAIQESPDLRDIEAVACEQGRFALAAHAARRASAPIRAAACEALALAEATKIPAGAISGALTERLGLIASHLEEGGRDRSVELLALAAALRAAVYDPSVESQRVLTSLGSAFGHLASTAEVLDAVLFACRAGVSVAAASEGVREAADLERHLQGARERAREELRTGPARTNKFTAATVVWSRWIQKDGLLGSLLDAAANDERHRLSEVASTVVRLRRTTEVEAEMRKADNRATKRNEITAGARARLFNWVNDVLDIVNDWLNAVRASEARSGLDGRPGVVVTRLRDVAREGQAGVDRDLQATVESELPLRAAADAARRSIRETLKLIIEGTPAESSELPLVFVLYGDLLLARGPRMRDDGPERDPTVDELKEALSADPEALQSWKDAAATRNLAGDYDESARIVEHVRVRKSELADEMGADRTQSLQRRRVEVQHELSKVEQDVASARTHGHIDDDMWSELSGRVEGLRDPKREDLGRVVRAIAEIRDELDASRTRAKASFEQRLATVIDDRERDGRPVDEMALTRMRERAERQDFATAEEYLALVSDSLDLPSPPQPTTAFTAWWPELSEEIRNTPVTGKMVVAARTGKRCGPLDFSSLEAPVRDEVAAGIEAWLSIGAEWSREHLHVAAAPILSLLGLEVAEIVGIRGEKGGAERSWRVMKGVRRTGKALVPDFGSLSSGAATGDALLLLLVKGRTPVNVVASWISQEQSARPVMLWYFGALDRKDRLYLADEMRAPNHRRPVAIVDDCVITYLAASGGRSFETVMQLTLPFVASNPYQAVGGMTPPEMFYGRGPERRSLRDMTGSALVYGGRQLGKSSLLRATQRDFDDRADRRAVYIDLKAAGLGISHAPSEAWPVLWNALREAGVLTKDAPATGVRDKFESEVLGWLRLSPSRALLVLLDECDRFFQSDADDDFATVDALDALMLKANRQVKFVFAGLHRVQRYLSVENQPLAHLGVPIAVGPLRSPEAMDLVVRPMEALGYRFGHDELPSRILAICNNNPSLIVLFMQALVSRLLDSQKLSRPTRPPVIVTDEDVQATASKESLAEQIRERFELTLDLDPAYKVIAYTVAHEAMERGPSVALTTKELRNLASSWWPAGFAGLGYDGFRSLCEELADLGVLARRRGSYGLRSPNILRFLGSADQIAEVLVEAETRKPVENFAASAALPRLGDPNERSPLTAAQLADLIAPRNQVRLVITSVAHCGERIPVAMTRFAGARISLETVDPMTARLGSYRNTTGRHRVLYCDLRSVDDDRATKLVTEALARRSEPHGTVGVVFVAWPANIGFLQLALSNEPEPWSRIGIVESTPVTPPAWRHWVEEAELPIADPDAVHTRTGGWMPWLELAATASQENRRLAEVLDGLRSDESAARKLINDSGVGDPPLRGVFDAFVQANGIHEEEAGELAAMMTGDAKQGAALFEILKVLGALVLDGNLVRPEPVLAAAYNVARSRAD
jgi:hypothetical protein